MLLLNNNLFSVQLYPEFFNDLYFFSDKIAPTKYCFVISGVADSTATFNCVRLEPSEHIKNIQE